MIEGYSKAEPESQKLVRQKLESDGWLVIGPAGAPDFFAYRPDGSGGKFVEAKRKGDVLSSIQKEYHSVLRSCHILVEILVASENNSKTAHKRYAKQRSRDEIIKALEKAADEVKNQDVLRYYNQERFLKLAGVTMHELKRCYAKWSDCQESLGLPFYKSSPTKSEEISTKISALRGLIEKLGRYPTTREVILEHETGKVASPGWYQKKYVSLTAACDYASQTVRG